MTKCDRQRDNFGATKLCMIYDIQSNLLGFFFLKKNETMADLRFEKGMI